MSPPVRGMGKYFQASVCVALGGDTHRRSRPSEIIKKSPAAAPPRSRAPTPSASGAVTQTNRLRARRPCDRWQIGVLFSWAVRRIVQLNFRHSDSLPHVLCTPYVFAGKPLQIYFPNVPQHRVSRDQPSGADFFHPPPGFLAIMANDLIVTTIPQDSNPRTSPNGLGMRPGVCPAPSLCPVGPQVSAPGVAPSPP